MAPGQAKPAAEAAPDASMPAASRIVQHPFWLAAAGVLLLGLLLKAALLAADAFPFNADEAVVGLMARHILAGHWPTFFYGQAYLGSLDATIVAFAFTIIGETVLAIRIVQSVLFLGLLLTTMLLAREMGFTVIICSLAGLLLAVPSVNVTLYTTVSLGGYGEALLLGNLILLATLILHRRPSPAWAYALWGALVGFGLWVFGLTLVYSVPSAVLLVADAIRRATRRQAALRLVAALAGALVGVFPMVLWGVANGPGTLLRELLGSAIAGASPSQLSSAVVSHLANFVLFGPTVALGVRPPWGISPLGMPLTPVVAVLWIAAIGIGLRRASWPAGGLAGRNLLLSTALTLFLGFLLTPFGADPSGRYFLPLAVPLAIVASAGVDRARVIIGRPWPLALAGVVLAFNLWTTVQAATHAPGLTTQFDAATLYDRSFDPDLVDFLLEREETSGYTTYWVAYPLAFLSQERLVYLPHLPYHSDFRYTSRDDRYAPYRAVVAAASRPAYITARQPWLDTYLRETLKARGVGFEETTIGDYRVFHTLTEPVRPEDLGLGPEASP
jgi:hypothetical protein